MERIELADELRQLIVEQELRVGHQQSGPAPHPLVAQRKLSGGLNGAAERVCGRAVGPVAVGEKTRVSLENACGLDRVRALQQALAPYALKQLTLFPGRHHRGGQVGARRDRPEIGNFDPGGINRAVGDVGEQKAALAGHRRIGRRHEREIGERHAEELDARILEIDHLLAAVVDDPGGLDLPKRRFFRVLLTRFASGVDAVLQHRVLALVAVGARCGKAGVVDGLDPQCIDKAVAVIVGEIDELPVGDLAVGFGQPDIAARLQPLALLVVGYLVGFDGRAVVIDLNAAHGGDGVVGIVVADLRRLQEHGRVGGRRCRLRRRSRPGREVQQIADTLGRHWRRREQGACAENEQSDQNRDARTDVTNQPENTRTDWARH